jgi:hypothetical protein
MRVLMTHRHKNPAKMRPPSPELFAEMGKLIEDMTKAGILVATGGFGPGSKGVRVAFEGGKMTVIDGPFAEAKEMIAGFALVEVKSLDEAVEWAEPFASLVGDVEIDIRALA